MKTNETLYLVEQPSLDVLNSFQGYTAEATRQMANANCCIRTSGIEYFGLYTLEELETMRQKRAERNPHLAEPFRSILNAFSGGAQ